MIKPDKLFTEEDKKRIDEAVKLAEKGTSGEIVPFVVGQSDGYPEAMWRAGTLVAFLVLFGFAVLDFGTRTWAHFHAMEIGLFVIGGFFVGALFASVFPPLKRLFVPSDILQQRVDERAALAFLSEEVFSTRDRTGILIFLSLFEHRVRILGDSGINVKVQQDEWDEIVRIIVQGMKSRQPARGLLEAVQKCGALLESRGVDIRPDDTNELENTLRIQDR